MTYFFRISGFLAILIFLISSESPAEGRHKPKVGNIAFSGNEFYSESRLEGLMLTRSSKFLAASRFRQEIFEDDIENIITFYRQNGFLQARIVDTLIVADTVKNHIDISISIEEGARTYVEGVTIFGNYAFPDTVLNQYIGIKAGDPLRRPVIEDGVVNMLSLYAEYGYLDASISPKVQVNDSEHLALVDFTLDEGVQSFMGEINILGTEKTKTRVILRELTFVKGDTVKYSRLIDSQRNLYLTGLFESVFVRPAQSDSGEAYVRGIKIEVKEKPSSELAFSIGYGTIEKVRGRVALSTSNLAGTARKTGLSMEANFIRQGIAASFSEPWTLGTRWNTDLSIFGQLKQEPGFDAEIVGGKITVGRKIFVHRSISLSYRFENTNLSNIDFADQIKEYDPRIRSLTLTLSHDSRDNLFDPSSGWYANWSNEFAGSYLQGSDTFARSIIILKSFISLDRNTVIGSAIEIGWMDAFGESKEIPLSERFYTGGPTSLRGFGYQMVGPLDTNLKPMGGQFKVVCNFLELRRSIYRMVGGALFLEFGNIWSDPKKARLSDLRLDAGIGLRLNSPLGILRLDYGINPERYDDEPGSKLFFSMGQAF